ncbi:hypothetical protein SLEP1_g50569 [Rubroshorea leprosula]|uniref:Uncharacterized protein n=1 Tax=Rubroshorea leprosula TaxID=152421 RepID=A0AAV5M0J6_9ROSI|nr:hypothetical protein SLEP1_g50569 [Rubroshorea leprosula]
MMGPISCSQSGGYQPLHRSPKVVVGFTDLVAMEPLTGDGHRLMGSPRPGVLVSRIAVVLLR